MTAESDHDETATPACGPTAAKPWLKSYPPGVPAEIGALDHRSVGALIEAACKRYADRPAFICMGATLTYRDLDAHGARLAAWLQSRGLAPGDRVAVMMPNVLQYPVAIAAILRAGFTVVNVNPLYTPRELEHQLRDSGAVAIVVLENFAATLSAVIDRTGVKHVCVAALGDMLGLKGHLVNFVVRRVRRMVPAFSLPDHTRFPEALRVTAPFASADTGPDDIAFLQYTGGTTGVSKGAMLTNRNVLANAMQNRMWLDMLRGTDAMPDAPNYVCCLPLYHIFALTVNAVMGIDRGACNILIPNPRDIPGFVKELGKRPFHVLPGLNTLFNALLANEAFRRLDFSRLKITLGGGMAVQRPTAERWREVTGCSIAEGYGLSETAPVVTANRLDLDEFTGTIGLPLPATEVDIRDDAGASLPFGEVGEVCIRGPQVMAGYWNRPEETAGAMDADGWFRSGDLGFMDENGYVTIVDRKKDMILVSGFNVYPNEIEEVVSGHDGILEAAVIGVPDSRTGEAVKLFVVRQDPDVDEEAVRAWCAERLTNYKRPEYVVFRDELPKSNVGKILRRELREADGDEAV